MTHTTTARERRKVTFATVVGTAIEWYDFFLYAAAAGLVFTTLMFKPMGPSAAVLASFMTVGLSFLFRPLGAFLAGHFGDKIGRRRVLMATLVMMGSATALIGVLPTYQTAGMIAPILLVLLRIIQGISAGGEWGGAVLMAVEHAPKGKRGIYGASPQVGVPLGLIMASGMLAVMAQIAPGEAFLAWGWRIPFLFSVVLIGVGIWIRRGVEESPVFQEIAERKDQAKRPVTTLFRKHFLLVLLTAGLFIANNGVGYMTTGGYIQNYATNPDGPLGLNRGPVLWIVAASAVTWLIFILIGGAASDRFGRRTVYIVGWLILLAGIAALFPLVNQGSYLSLYLGLAGLTVGLGLTYGQQSAMYAELFPASIRFSGVSISYALGSILGGAFAPTIATALVQRFHTTDAVALYLAGLTVVSLVCTLLLKDRTGIPLGPDHEEEQARSPIVFARS